MATDHKQVEITTQFAKLEVDEGIAPLIEALHAAGAWTWNSCEHQAHRGDFAWVELDLWGFMDLNQRAWTRVKEHYETRDSYDPEFANLHGWMEEECEQTFGYEDNGTIDENDTWVDGDELGYSVSLRFPREEIALFIELLEPHKIKTD